MTTPIDALDPPEPPFDVSRYFMATQRAIAVALLALFAVSALAPLAFVAGGHWNEAKQYMQIALPAEIGLLGSAVGFYFGAESQGGA